MSNCEGLGPVIVSELWGLNRDGGADGKARCLAHPAYCTTQGRLDGSVNICADCLCNRGAVIAVDRHAGKETQEFQPQKRTKLYGIATAYAQCPSGIKQTARAPKCVFIYF